MVRTLGPAMVILRADTERKARSRMKFYEGPNRELSVVRDGEQWALVARTIVWKTDDE